MILPPSFLGASRRERHVLQKCAYKSPWRTFEMEVVG